MSAAGVGRLGFQCPYNSSTGKANPARGHMIPAVRTAWAALTHKNEHSDALRSRKVT